MRRRRRTSFLSAPAEKNPPNTTGRAAHPAPPARPIPSRQEFPMDPMLIESGLFGRGLVTINTQKSVAMFNEALGSLGIEPTKLKRFDIDGVGWSPQIAAERGDPHYMGAGATRFGIIATPEHEGKPIHIPMFSFKRRLERQYFDRFKRPIIDTTTSSCVVQEFIHDTLLNESPKDFVFMDEVLVHSSAGRPAAMVAAQRQLRDTFMGAGAAGVD